MLQLTWTTALPPARNHLVAVAVREEPEQGVFDARFGKAVREAAATARFLGKTGETFAFTTVQGDVLERVVLLGVGDLHDAANLRTFAHDAVRQGHAAGVATVVLDLRTFAGDAFSLAKDAAAAMRAGDVIAQGCELGGYAYEQFIAPDKRLRKTVREVIVVADDARAAESSARGQIIAAAIARARDLANGPAALVTPTHLADTATEIVASLAADHDVSIVVLDRDECSRRNMGCFLGVAQGSDEPPKFIHMSYRPRGASKGRVCLIGKGVTFDSGGYSLKPTEGMLDMKMDMAGAAAVIAAFEAAVRVGVEYEVHSIVAATENMVSGRAYRLGDVLTASNGKTVEINNTDAEGRLTLGDAMVYAAKLDPSVILDFATLTGACIVALGPWVAGAFGDDDQLMWNVLESARSAGEDIWRLPMTDTLKDVLKSDVADMKNAGDRMGGSITAAHFLKEFVGETPWVHLDIAGPSNVNKEKGYMAKGATGFAVRTLVEFIRRRTAELNAAVADEAIDTDDAE